MDAGAAVDRMVEKSRAAASALGEMLEAIYEVSSASPDPDFAAVEVAFALRLTRFAAEDQVRLARELCVRLPDVLQSLIASDIDLARARVFAEVLAALDKVTAREIAAAVLPVAPEKTTGQLRDLLRRRALSADPAYTKARRERAHARRGVQLHAADDGTATLAAFGLDAVRLTAAFARISAVARARRLTGAATGKLEQVRADVLLELLEGQHAAAAAGVTQFTVSLETLAELRNDPGLFGRYGPVAADIARQWVEAHPGFQWQFAVRAPDGTLLQQGLTRARPANPPHDPDRPTPPNTQPKAFGGGMRDEASAAWFAGLARPPGQDPRDRFANAAMMRWIRLRDVTCRAPGCRMPAVRCDVDHSLAYASGGSTSHDNLCALCRYHHRVKHEGGWTVIQMKPGYFRWISPLGRSYDVMRH